MQQETDLSKCVTSISGQVPGPAGVYGWMLRRESGGYWWLRFGCEDRPLTEWTPELQGQLCSRHHGTNSVFSQEIRHSLAAVVQACRGALGWDAAPKSPDMARGVDVAAMAERLAESLVRLHEPCIRSDTYDDMGHAACLNLRAGTVAISKPGVWDERSTYTRRSDAVARVKQLQGWIAEKLRTELAKMVPEKTPVAASDTLDYWRKLYGDMGAELARAREALRESERRSNDYRQQVERVQALYERLDRRLTDIRTAVERP